jgi:hypothetical protein
METTDLPTYRLYSPGQIALASFLGAPLAACWLWSHNYRRLGEARRATRCLIWGVAGTAILVTIAFFLPEHFPSTVIPIGYTVGLYQVAKQSFGTAITQHLAAGGRPGSWWAVVGVGVAGLCIVLAVIVGISLLLPSEP